MVTVDAHGISVGEAKHPWEDLHRCTVDAAGGHRSLILLTSSGSELERLPCAGLDERDALWLACYLESQAKRFTLTPEERSRQDQERARLSGLVQAVRHEEPGP